jgi:hypothetical protein
MQSGLPSKLGVTFSAVKNVRLKVSVGTLEDVASLDFKSPFDELTELRAVLTTQEIAELTGLRRETISRARPDSRFQRRTAKALEDLYLVVTQLRSARGDETGQLVSVLRRPQAELAGRSIAELLRDGQVDVVLRALSTEAPTEAEEIANFRLSPEVEAQLEPWREPSDDEVVRDPDLDQRIEAFLDAVPELRTRLGAIEAALVEQFGPGAKVERQIIDDFDAVERGEEFYLRVRADLSFDEEIDRLVEFLQREQDLLDPVHRHLVIGFL